MKTTNSVNTLVRLFMEAAEREGFRFVCSPREEFPCATKAPQILWLDYPQFLSQEGNQHGRQRYRLRVALLRREVKDTEEMRMAYMTYAGYARRDVHLALDSGGCGGCGGAAERSARHRYSQRCGGGDVCRGGDDILVTP